MEVELWTAALPARSFGTFSRPCQRFGLKRANEGRRVKILQVRHDRQTRSPGTFSQAKFTPPPSFVHTHVHTQIYAIGFYVTFWGFGYGQFELLQTPEQRATYHANSDSAESLKDKPMAVSPLVCCARFIKKAFLNRMVLAVYVAIAAAFIPGVQNALYGSSGYMRPLGDALETISDPLVCLVSPSCTHAKQANCDRRSVLGVGWAGASIGGTCAQNERLTSVLR